MNCPMCLGDGDCWITEDQAWLDCPYCGGSGRLAESQAVLADNIIVRALLQCARFMDVSEALMQRWYQRLIRRHS